MLQRRTLYCESNSLHPVKGKNIIEKTEYRNRLVAHQEIQNSVTLLGYSVLVGILFLTRLQIFINSLFVKISNQIVQLEEEEPDRNYKRGMRKRYV